MAKDYGLNANGDKVDITRGDLVRFWPTDLIQFASNYRYASVDSDPAVQAEREAKIEEMVQSLCRIGQKQPILIHEVAGKRFQVHAGDTRHQAFLRINQRRIWPFNKPSDPPEEKGLARVECKVEEKGDDKITFGASVAENIERNELTCVEIANAVMLAINRYHYTDAEVMKTFRQTDPAWLPNMRRLARLPAERKREIHLGQLAASVGYILAEIPEDRHEEVLAEAAGEAMPEVSMMPEVSIETYPEGTVAGFSSGIDETPSEPERQLDYSESQVKTPVIQPNKPKRRKKVTARAVAAVAKSKGLLKHKKVSITLAQIREFWGPIAEERKESLASRLAKANLEWLDTSDNDAFWKALLAMLKEVK